MSSDLNITMDNSNVEEETQPYLKECNFIITKKLEENHISSNKTEELESKDLNWQCQEVNRKTHNLTRYTHVYIKKVEELDIDIYQFNESAAKILGSLEKTGVIITLINQELNKLKHVTSNNQKNNTSFEHRLNKIKNLLKQKQTIKKLEEETEQLLQTSLDNDDLLLPKQHEELITDLKYIEEQLISNQSNNAEQLKIKEKQIEMLQEIYMLQETNNEMKKNIYEKNKIQEAMHNEILNSRAIGLNEAIKRQDMLKTELNEHVTKNRRIEHKIENMKLDIAKKDHQLLELNQEQTEKQLKNKQVEEKYLEELQNSREILFKTERDMTYTENQIFTSKKILTEKVQTYKDLQNQKEDLITAICENKVTYLKIQYSHSQKQFKIDALNEKMLGSAAYVKNLNMKIEEIEKNVTNTENDIERNIKEFTEKKTKVLKEHHEKVKHLYNQQNYQEASIELMQNRLENSLKKIEKIKKDIKERETDIKWDEIKLEVQKGSLRTLRDKVQKQQELNENLIDKNLHKNDEPTRLILTENTNDIIESEDNQVNNTTGRRSPGILKNIRSPKRPATPNKKVKFQGIPSTDSSTQSDIIKNSTAQKQLDKMSQDSWNKLVFSSIKNTCKLTKSNKK